MKLSLPYDIYERHKKVGSFIENGETVLDVGGELNQLSQFCQPSKIVVANLKKSQENSDVIVKKGKLPFKKSSFDVACAIDVLEHIPKNERRAFIKNLQEVSAKKVILSFPIGTSTHINYEKELQNYLEGKKYDVTYLKEHIALGLPQKKELETILEGQNFNTYYSGNLSFNKILFKLHVFDPHVKYFRKFVYLSKLAFNLITNKILYVVLSNRSYSQNVVREYVLIRK